MTAQEYYDAVSAERQEDMEKVRTLIKRVFPEAAETMAYRLPTYVVDQETVVSLASQKSYMALYFCYYDLLKEFSEELKQFNCGKSCVRFKRLEEGHFETFEKILKHVRDHKEESQLRGKSFIN